MELNQFVSETIIQIINGVNKAQSTSKGTGALVAPQRYGDGGYFYIRKIEVIEFDVAITTTDTTEGKAGAGIFVAGISLGGQAREEVSNQTLSRIKFNVPIFLPAPIIEK